MKQKITDFLNRNTTMDTLITACMVTFLLTIALVVVWMLAIVGNWGNLVNTMKFAQILSVIERVYIGEADTEELCDDAFAVMIESLGDRWSYYMTEEEYERYQTVQSNSYSGVGLTLQKTEEGWLITAVAADSPADRAGMQPNTYLVAVNDLRLTNETASEISEMIRQDPENIRLVTADADGNEQEYAVTIAEIYQNPVSYEMMEDSVGYVRLENFDETCAEEAIKAVDALVEQGAEALIFDVRDNGGGYVTELCDLLDYLLPEGDLFVSVDENGKETVTKSDAD